MTHLDICNTNYGKKKGQESNWRFDSRPQNVGNRPDFRVYRWRATHHWKAFDESYNFASNLVSIGSLNVKLQPRKVVGGLTLAVWSSNRKGVSGQKTIWMQPLQRGAEHTIWGKVVASSSSGRGESCESEIAHGLTQHQRCSNIVLTKVLVGLIQIRMGNKIACHSSQSHPGALACPSTLLKCCEPRSVPRLLAFPLSFVWDSHLGPSRSWECVMSNGPEVRTHGCTPCQMDAC